VLFSAGNELLDPHVGVSNRIEGEASVILEAGLFLRRHVLPDFAGFLLFHRVLLAGLTVLLYVILMQSSSIVIQNSGRKVGRPPIGDKAASLYAMRLPDELIAELDAYAEREGIKSRSEAVRRLLESALKPTKRTKRRKAD
jgi:hypothetical protein